IRFSKTSSLIAFAQGLASSYVVSEMSDLILPGAWQARQLCSRMRMTSLLNITFVVMGSCVLPVLGSSSANRKKRKTGMAIAARERYDWLGIELSVLLKAEGRSDQGRRQHLRRGARAARMRAFKEGALR